jgi:hypothetical protein
VSQSYKADHLIDSDVAFEILLFTTEGKLLDGTYISQNIPKFEILLIDDKASFKSVKFSQIGSSSILIGCLVAD